MKCISTIPAVVVNLSNAGGSWENPEMVIAVIIIVKVNFFMPTNGKLLINIKF
jgi:hypothetical protein